MIKQYMNNFYTFMQFMRRDFLVYKKNWKRIAINFAFFSTVVFSLATGFILPRVSFAAPTDEQVLIFFAGSILWTIFPIAFILNLRFLLDMEYQRFIDYQMLILSPRLVILQRVLFTAFVIFVNVLLFYPSYLLISNQWHLTQHVSWPSLFIVLLFASLFCSVFTLLVFVFVGKTQYLSTYFIRLNYPLISLGGLMIPWYPIWLNAKPLAYALLLNPFIYVTEGLRMALTGKDIFFPVWVCVAALALTCVLCLLLTWYFFKKRMDHS